MTDRRVTLSLAVLCFAAALILLALWLWGCSPAQGAPNPPGLVTPLVPYQLAQLPDELAREYGCEEHLGRWLCPRDRSTGQLTDRIEPTSDECAECLDRGGACITDLDTGSFISCIPQPPPPPAPAPVPPPTPPPADSTPPPHHTPPPPASGGGVCSGITPAHGAPPPHGALAPTEANIHPARDTTNYTGREVTDADYPLFQSVRLFDSGGQAFLASAYFNGFHVWRLNDPARPALHRTMDGRAWGRGLGWCPPSEVDEIVHAADVSPDGQWLALSSSRLCDAGPGLTLWTDLTTGPTLVWQRADRGTTDASFLGPSTIVGASATFAPGVWAYSAVDGADLATLDTGSYGAVTTVGDLVAISPARFDGRPVKLYDLSDPTTPVLLDTGPAIHSLGVALWERGGVTYLAVTGANELRIYKATPALTLVASWPTVGSFKHVTHSRSNGHDYLHLGGLGYLCGTTERTEQWLLVDDPTRPQDLMSDGLHDHYRYGWVYATRGIVHGGYAYRAARSLLDVFRVRIAIMTSGLEPGERWH